MSEVKWLSEVERTRPRVKIRRGMVVIDCSQTREIELSRLSTPEKLIGCIHHLAPKLWMDGTMIRELIDVVAGHFGWEIHSW